MAIEAEFKKLVDEAMELAEIGKIQDAFVKLSDAEDFAAANWDDRQRVYMEVDYQLEGAGDFIKMMID